MTARPSLPRKSAASARQVLTKRPPERRTSLVPAAGAALPARRDNNNNNNNNSNAGKNSNNNSNNNNGSSSTTKDTTKDSGPKSTEKVDKEPKEKVDKGRQVAGDRTGTGGGYVKPLNLTGQPVPDDSGGGSGKPTNIRVGVGPGARPLQEPAGGASGLRFDTRTLVINPNPVGLTGRGTVTPLDPNGGRR